MSVRENLLRLHRWQLEERQNYLIGLESLVERLRADARRLQDEAEEGARVSGHLLDDGGVYPLFVRPLIERRRKIERSIVEVDMQIAEARASVTAAMQEVKLYEGALGQHSGATPTRHSRRPRREPNYLAAPTAVRKRSV